MTDGAHASPVPHRQVVAAFPTRNRSNDENPFLICRRRDTTEFAQLSTNRCWEAWEKMLCHLRHDSKSEQIKRYLSAAARCHDKEIMHVSGIVTFSSKIGSILKYPSPSPSQDILEAIKRDPRHLALKVIVEFRDGGKFFQEVAPVHWHSLDGQETPPNPK